MNAIVSSLGVCVRLATGRGLRLGDARRRVEELYGTAFVERHVTGPEIGSAP